MTPTKHDFGPGSRVEQIGQFTLCCIAPETRDLLDRVMAAWNEHKKDLPETMTVGDETWNPRESVYGFAYWLIRWSGLVEPAKSPDADVRASI